MAVSTMILLYAYKYASQRWKKLKPIPFAFLLVMLGTFLSWYFDLANTDGLRIVGDIPSGPPPLSSPVFDTESVLEVLLVSIAIAVISYITSLSVVNKYAREKNYKVDTNQELVALGAACLAGSFFSAFAGSARYVCQRQSTLFLSSLSIGDLAYISYHNTQSLSYNDKCAERRQHTSVPSSFHNTSAHHGAFRRSDLCVPALLHTRRHRGSGCTRPDRVGGDAKSLANLQEGISIVGGDFRLHSHLGGHQWHCGGSHLLDPVGCL